MLHRQNELHQATLGGDLVQIQRKQNKFADAYFEAHGKVKARISSEERNRRRKRAEMRRAEERKRRVGNGSRK